MYRHSLILVALLAAASHAHAQTKASDFFPDGLTHDFGSVPRGQVVTNYFRIVNNTKQPVRIANVRVSCNVCSSARAMQMYLQPGQETAIAATMDTNRFFGSKTITISVTFDQPRWEEVRLWMQANSRDDVTFAPDSIAFGRVKRGVEAESKMTISFLSAAGFQITEVKSESNYVQPSVNQLPRGNANETVYEISAKLRKDTPDGKWYTDLWLTTNHPAMPKLRVPVTVEVLASLTVSPSTISLGSVKAGEETDRKVIIRGVRPFRIVNISGTDNQVQVRPTNNESKAVHVLTVTLNPREVGELTRRIRVETDLKTNGEIEFLAQAQVVP
jgi:hypothetical protein